MLRAAPRLAVCILLALLLAGCARFGSGEEGGPIPDDPPTAMGEPATGPIIVLGSGMADGHGWRYSAYESAMGWCTQIEMPSSGGGGCGGDLELGEGENLTLSGSGSGSEGPAHWEGLVSSEAEAVWLETSGGERYSAVLLDLARAGLPDQLFLVFAPAGSDPGRLVATGPDGVTLADVDVSGLGAHGQPPETTSSARSSRPMLSRESRYP